MKDDSSEQHDRRGPGEASVNPDSASREVSRILRAAADGEPVDQERLLPLVYGQLRAIAGSQMREERPGHTLSPTALVHEAYMRLVGDGADCWSSRAHFYGAAAEAMRRILVDHARARGTRKRGGDRLRIALDVVELASRENPLEILALDEALSRLEGQDPRMAAIVKLRFFAGLEEEKVARALDVSRRTVTREWTMARAFLQREMTRE
jgi:RNA polymerase sigma factor (TIGR02999 family)